MRLGQSASTVMAAAVISLATLAGCVSLSGLTGGVADDAGPRDGGRSHDAPHAESSGSASASTTTTEARCSSVSADLVLAQSNHVYQLPLAWDDAGVAPAFANDNGLTCPTTVVASTKVRFRAFVVENQTEVPATLAAWLECYPESAAYLAFYASASPPATDTALAHCATLIARGSALNGLASQDSNGSPYCPGLAVTNDGGLRLEPCERAVVYVEAVSVLERGDGGKDPSALDLALE